MIQTPSESPFFRVLLTRPKDLQIRFGESCIGDALFDIGVACVPFCLCMYLFVLVRIDVLVRNWMFLPFARHSILKNFGFLGPAWTVLWGEGVPEKCTSMSQGNTILSHPRYPSSELAAADVEKVSFKSSVNCTFTPRLEWCKDHLYRPYGVTCHSNVVYMFWSIFSDNTLTFSAKIIGVPLGEIGGVIFGTPLACGLPLGRTFRWKRTGLTR